jgi:hypothetical protein
LANEAPKKQFFACYYGGPTTGWWFQSPALIQTLGLISQKREPKKMKLIYIYIIPYSYPWNLPKP